jgi:hypothetical protein
MVKSSLRGLMTPVLPPFYRLVMSGMVRLSIACVIARRVAAAFPIDRASVSLIAGPHLPPTHLIAPPSPHAYRYPARRPGTPRGSRVPAPLCATPSLSTVALTPRSRRGTSSARPRTRPGSRASWLQRHWGSSSAPCASTAAWMDCAVEL